MYPHEQPDHEVVIHDDLVLPSEFDSKIYLAIHKDVAEAGIDPVQHYLIYGRKEGRRLFATRTETLRGPIGRTASIVEVGASFNPIAAKSEGWNTKTIDVATRSELIDKYRGQPGVDVDRIEEVDFVWRDGPLSTAVPPSLHGTFDAFIASHVIEHSPDLLGFLDSASTLLAATGVVILAIPDKRFCFDYFRPLAMTGDVLASHTAHRNRHTAKTIFNHNAYVVSADGTGAWGQCTVKDLHFFYSLETAYSTFLTSNEDDTSPYVDMHAWQFTPASFELLLLELARLKQTDWKVDWIGPASGCEFLVWLRRGGDEAASALTEAEVSKRRLDLLKRTLVETKEQVEFLATARLGVTGDAGEPMTRTDKILKLVNRSGAGLEIGPSFNPVTPKRAGYNVKIIDFMSTEQLVSLNAARNHDTSLIENVDYIWDGRSFRDIIGPEQKFDWIIASHVIEHTPDFITFINDCESILNPNGIVSLVIPDKRYCFDYFRPVSSLSQVVDAFIARRKFHSPGAVIEYFLYHCWNDGKLAWDDNYPSDIRFPYSIEFAKDMFAKAASGQDYIDIHAWCFTPSCFRLLLKDLASLELITLKECVFFPTAGTEFFVSLSRQEGQERGSRVSRISLMHKALQELRQQPLSHAMQRNTR
jgi:2-polyprenyl-3-methyl-5-hydroxy-6-metoxy-1,4-benzoquinol methylase